MFCLNLLRRRLHVHKAPELHYALALFIMTNSKLYSRRNDTFVGQGAVMDELRKTEAKKGMQRRKEVRRFALELHQCGKMKSKGETLQLVPCPSFFVSVFFRHL